MKAPFTRKYVQANTHKAILDIGFKIEQDILNKHEMEKQQALEMQKKILAENFQDSILEQIKDAEAVERAACHREMQRLAEEFESQLADQLNALQTKMEKEFEAFSNNHQEILKHKWETKLKSAVQDTTHYITKQLMEELSRQEKILEKHFNTEFKKKEIRRRYEIEKQTTEYKKTMQEARHRLECKNITNMMYILCLERRKCLEEKELIENYYMSIQSELNKRVARQKKKIESLKNELEHQINQVNLREICCMEIIKQYQKFINFALRASPTQAQFLLSIQKLTSFELAFKETSPTPKRSSLPCDTVIPWVQPQQAIKEEESLDLFIGDYHDCLNELAIPKIEGETELPAFTYKEKLYVREDFRNLISQGIRLTPSHDMWSEDVELLFKTLRESVSHLETHESEVMDEEGNKKDLSYHKPDSQEKKHGEENFPDKFIAAKDKSLLKPQSLNGFSTFKVEKVENQDTNPGLLGTTSSVEMIMKQGKVKSHKPSSLEGVKIEEQIQVQEPRESLELKKIKSSDHMMMRSIAGSSSSAIKPIDDTKDEEPKKKMSKLISTRDSVTHLRESRQALLAPSVCSYCQKKELLKPYYLTKEYCCEKCLKRGVDPVLDNLHKYKSTSLDIQKPLKLPNSSTQSREKALANMIFQPESNLMDAPVEGFYPEKFEKIYTRVPEPQNKKRKSQPDKAKKRFKETVKFDKYQVTKDYPLCNNDSTIKRMRSFITTMSDQPDLIKLFTACQR